MQYSNQTASCAGEVVAQFKYTLLLMPNGQMRITQGPAFDPELYESQYKIEDAEILVMTVTEC